MHTTSKSGAKLMIFNLIKWLFSSTQERQSQAIIAAHNAQSLELVKGKAQVLLDQVTATQLYQNCELFHTLQQLTACALERKESIIVKGKQRTIWVNYDRMANKATINFQL